MAETPATAPTKKRAAPRQKTAAKKPPIPAPKKRTGRPPKTAAPKGSIPLAQMHQFLASVADIESQVYGDVTFAVVTVKLAGRTMTAQYDGKQWHLH